MAGLSRTRTLGLVGLLGGWAVLLACGHLPFEDIANTEDAGASPESGSPQDSGLSDARDSASLDAGRDVTDGGCAGPTCIGTFVSGSIGIDSNPGTAAMPVQTIEKATEIAVALGGKQSVFVAAAHYPEKVTLAEGVDLLGGYDCNATSCTWARDVAKNDTAQTPIDSGDMRGRETEHDRNVRCEVRSACAQLNVKHTGSSRIQHVTQLLFTLARRDRRSVVRDGQWLLRRRWCEVLTHARNFAV